MFESGNKVVSYGLDERHDAIAPFNPEESKDAAHALWGQTPYHRVDVARYISPEHVALERDRLWPHVWQIACREEEIPKPGDYIEYKICDQPIVVIRTNSGRIKAYFNSCLHRGTKLAKGCGHISQFICPFHGWRWSLDGENRYVHDRAEFPGLTKKELQLPECRVGQWGGFVFVNLTDDGQSLESFLSPISAHLAPYHLEDYRIKWWRTITIGANWKIALEAFEEVYHLMGTHPQTVLGNCDVNCSYDTFGPHSRMIVPVGLPSARYRGEVNEQEVLRVSIENLLDVNLATEVERTAMEALRDQPLPEGETTRSYFQKIGHARYHSFMPDIPVDQFMDDWDYTVFPNLVFNLFPGSFFGFIARPNGTDPDSCIFDVIALTHPADEPVDRVPRETITDPKFDWGVTVHQDLENLERVQQGMHARTTKQTRLASYQEKRIVNRLTHIDQYYEKYKG